MKKVLSLILLSVCSISFSQDEGCDELVVEADVEDCDCCWGSIFLNVTGGAPPYMYSWSDGSFNFFTGASGDSIQLTPGDYCVTITDEIGCETVECYTIDDIALEISVTSATESLLCFGDSDGWINIELEGGVPPYIYSWSNGAITEDLSGIGAGIYSVDVVDQNLCPISIDVEIPEPGAIQVDFDVQDAICDDESGSIVITEILGGNPPYEIDWQNIDTEEVPIGTHEFTIIDANSCVSLYEYTINNLTIDCGQGLTYIPDANFEQALIDLGYDDAINDSVLTANISTVSSLDLTNLGISDLTGIEDFLSIEVLICNQNNLTEINLSNNAELANFSINNNNLDVLDVSYNTNLIALDCVGNNLEQLNVSNNTSLSVLLCANNLLTELDISNNPSLVFLNCEGNNINCVQVWDVEYAVLQEESCNSASTEKEPCFHAGPDAVWSLDCENIILNEAHSSGDNSLIKTINILGRETTNHKGFQLHIYDDGSMEKKYIVK